MLWFTPTILAVGKQRQEGGCMFGVSLYCRVNFGSVWAVDEALSKIKKEIEASNKMTEYGCEYGVL